MSSASSDTKCEIETASGAGAQASSLTDLLRPVSKDLEAAIQEFIRQYESQHEVVVLKAALEDRTIQVESTPVVSGIVRLNFEYRGKADGNHGSSSVLVKIPRLSALYPLFSALKLYEKERYFYTTVLPQMYKPWSGHEKLTANLYASTPSNNILVLENLGESGFRVRKKGSLLDMTECKTVLKSLAHLHALSMKFKKSVDDDLIQLRVVFDENTEATFRGCSSLVSKLRQHEVISCLSSEARQRFDEFCGDVNGNIYLGYMPNADGPNVILHGDLHFYNMLFRPGEETAACKFVDFQCSRRGSPIVDLMYFFVTSTDVRVFKEHKEFLFEYYLTVLNDTSEQVGIPGWYSFEQLKADFQKYKIFFVYVLTGIVPALWSGEWWDASVSHEADIFDVVLKSDRYISVFEKWMENFI